MLTLDNNLTGCLYFKVWRFYLSSSGQDLLCQEPKNKSQSLKCNIRSATNLFLSQMYHTRWKKNNLSKFSKKEKQEDNAFISYLSTS